MKDNEPFNDCQRIEYRRLMSRLADLVGHHQLPINRDARDINDFLEGNPVHQDLIRKVVLSIYRRGHCGHLDAEIRAETVFNSLGVIRGQLLTERDTDIDQINLLEDLGWASRVLFAAPPARQGDAQAEPDSADDPKPVVVTHPFA